MPRFDGNPERIRVDSDGQPGALALDVAAGSVVDNLVGPLDYGFQFVHDTARPDAAAHGTGGGPALAAVRAAQTTTS